MNRSTSNYSIKHKYSFGDFTQLNVKTVLFQTIQYLEISTQFQYQKEFYFKQFNLA